MNRPLGTLVSAVGVLVAGASLTQPWAHEHDWKVDTYAPSDAMMVNGVASNGWHPWASFGAEGSALGGAANAHLVALGVAILAVLAIPLPLGPGRLLFARVTQGVTGLAAAGSALVWGRLASSWHVPGTGISFDVASAHTMAVVGSVLIAAGPVVQAAGDARRRLPRA